MGMPDVDETEIEGAAHEIRMKYGDVIGENQARNIAYIALIGARGAKVRAQREAGRADGQTARPEEQR